LLPPSPMPVSPFFLTFTGFLTSAHYHVNSCSRKTQVNLSVKKDFITCNLARIFNLMKKWVP
jgi:hypothetical protein